ncbi:FAD-dependent oxidoreductase [Sutterella faecalis]|uniref:FAD-dependent oxidoreductase n=2 Tax=Sutterella TaxID=40544 RepID=A0AAI9S9E5_9BURK|nr:MULTISPECIES: FAD-dependent oxidoreductase [Sutterella]KAB7649615.1 FAD-dependent oxidoreductase [Sutterella seckii]QDA53885.1 FAD-dependent oxidoreductase [Sutterella faecalis]
MFSRRHFLTTSLAGTAVLCAASAEAAPVLSPTKWDATYDIVIAGAGGAGLAAACEAVDQKLSAVVYEKMAFMGGSSALCGGMIAAADTPEQKANGMKDSAEIFVKDLMVSGGGYADEKVVRAYVKEILEHYLWLTKTMGLKPDAVVQQGGQSVPRSHHFDPGKVLMTMADYAKKHGVKVKTKVKVERLVWSSDMKRIEGVRIEAGGEQKYIRARKGVLIATGGFAANPTMLAKYNPPLKEAAAISGKGTTGDGILMGLQAGSDMVDTAYIKASYGFKPQPVSIDEMTQVYWSGGIVVNQAARRFVDESISYKKMGDYALAQPEGKSYIVFDQAILERDYKNNPQGRVLWKPMLTGSKNETANPQR